jgi:hypothetical protein
MAYIGNTATTTNFTQGTDYFNGDGSTVAFTLSRPVSSVNDIEAIVNNVPQDPSSAYTVSGSTITFTGAPSSGTNNIRVRYLTTIQLANVPAAGSVTKTHLDVGMAGAGTGAMIPPIGTTAQRPTTPVIGHVRYNTTIDALENYTNYGWTRVAAPIPNITSVTGTIYPGYTSTLVLGGNNFETGLGSVTFTTGAVVKSVSITPASDSSISVAVPSEIYSVVAAGDTVGIKYTNTDNGVSTVFNKTVQGIPSGGTITTVGSYRYHTFTSSSSLVVPSGFSATADYLLVAGGGGGGYDYGGGGGAGGAIDSTVSLSAQTYSISIGAGGAGGNSSTPKRGNNGSNSTAFGQTAVAGGGGQGGAGVSQPAQSGGSGGGGGWADSTGASGTLGQGNKGGDGDSGGGSDKATGGGGGAGAVGQNGARSSKSGNGGAGINWKSLGTYYAGGGGGGGYLGYSVQIGTGGTGGGGNGALMAQAGSAGTANTGGGGGGDGGGPGPGPTAGGSGICIVRYQLS